MSARTVGTVGRTRLAAEFAMLFLVVPVGIAVALPPSAMFPILFAFTAIGLLLLHWTPGFAWHQLLRGRVNWVAVVAFGLITLAVGYGVIRCAAPGAEFALARQNPVFLAVIFLLYPVLSALPQEILYRSLFFRRYGVLLPSKNAAILLNAALFSLAHLMYWSWIVAAMTFTGGLVFAFAYEVRRSFPFALALHTAAGWAVFAVGLGVFFYSGNVVRPF